MGLEGNPAWDMTMSVKVTVQALPPSRQGMPYT